jgi:hypothetical protein
MDPTVGVGEPFRVPLSASYVEIFGEDAEGALLLAVVPLPGPEEIEVDGPEHLAVTLEGGQTLTVAIALDNGSGGKARAYVVQLTYTEPERAETPKAEVDRLQTQALALFADAARVQAQAITQFADIERMLVQAKQLLADVAWTQVQAIDLHSRRVQLEALRAHVKDALQLLQQLRHESPWVHQDDQDQDWPGPETSP